MTRSTEAPTRSPPTLTQPRPHRRTGELEQQVHVDDQKREGVYVVAGDPSDPIAFWGHMLEHGTSHSPPYPFLVPALEENEEAIKGAVAAVRSVT